MNGNIFNAVSKLFIQANIKTEYQVLLSWVLTKMSKNMVIKNFGVSIADCTYNEKTSY